MTHIKLDTNSLSEELREGARQWQTRAVEALSALSRGECAGADYTDWYGFPEKEGFKLAAHCKNWAEQYHLPFDLIVVAGIGGSYAGTRAIDEALRHSYQALLLEHGMVSHKGVPIVYAGHNLSESQTIELLDLLAGRQFVLNVISKSGTTTETSVAFRILRQFMEQRYGKSEASERIFVTTDPESGVLRELAKSEKYTSFEIPPGIGGRYSVLSAVGVVPLTLAGHDIEALMDGAHTLFTSLNDAQSILEHPAIQLAAVRRAAWDEGKRIDVLSYTDPKLAGFVEWWKQLFGESEGKDGKGLFPAGMSYTSDLHSLGQYLQEGPLTMMQTFLHFEEEHSRDQYQIERRLKLPKADGPSDGLAYLEGRYLSEINHAAMEGARIAHSERGVPCVVVSLRKLDAFALGYLTAFFEVVCAVSGLLLDVNPFDQPGVEAYKKNLFAILGKPGFEALRSELRARLN